MYEPLRRRALELLKIPPEPRPPTGDPASLRVFRAGRNYLRLRLGIWGIAQSLALAGILFWTALLIEVEIAVASQKPERERAIEAAPTPADATKPAEAAKPQSHARNSAENWAARFSKNVEAAHKKKPLRGWTGFKQLFVELALLLPAQAFTLIWAIKILGFTLYLIQIPVTYAVRRLDYEMRWYMVTDRSLRLRHGVWKVSESTMSFANLQQVVVSQDPIQRLLGLADVKVQSAGGGGAEKHQHNGEDMHVGLFHSVTNASEIRDLILDRLRRFRESGLGDPEERVSVESNVAPRAVHAGDPITAARELLSEARALRSALS